MENPLFGFMFDSWIGVLVIGVLAISAVTVSIIAVVIYKALNRRRDQTLWHKERMAMIEAGIDPDLPPNETPEAQTDDIHQTAPYPDT